MIYDLDSALSPDPGYGSGVPLRPFLHQITHNLMNYEGNSPKQSTHKR